MSISANYSTVKNWPRGERKGNNYNNVKEENNK